VNARHAERRCVHLSPEPDEGRSLVDRDATAADLDDVLAAGAVVFATPARFGALAGLTKDFLERIYPWFEEVPDVRPRAPATPPAPSATSNAS
jgi:multimeric flavodoxin WrbA